MQGGQDHPGMLRRCLHFDDGQHENTTSGSDSSNVLGNEDVLRAAVPTAGKGIINPSSQDKTAHLADNKLPNSSVPQTIGESIGKGTKPSGFGLHLNSFINSVQNGATVSMKSIGSGILSIHGKPSSIIRHPSSESSRSCSLSCNEANQFLANTNNDKIERVQAVAATSEAVLIPDCTELSEFEYLNPLEKFPCDKRKYSTSNSNINEELSQSSPKKKRLKTEGGDGCKRCNCKKTKCLKLYCDCFAAGIYCAGPCACQGCFNRPEYKDIVLGTRLQIESRNPHAFAPKIIQLATKASTKQSMEDVTLTSSARHKRGCNCKKSMCLKKYCECYQANVGCSDGCRCDGCQNVYGSKKEFGKNKHPSKQGISELCDVGKKKQEVASTNDTLQSSPLELTPETPPFQCSSHEKDGSKSWFPPARYLPSPESVTFADSFPISPGSSGNINNHGIIQDINKDILHLVPFCQELDDGNLVTADELLRAYHGPGSGSMTNHSSLSNSHDWATRMEPQCIYENRNPSSGSSLQWRRSPISLLTNFEENKYLGSTDSDGAICEAPEDDTPDILKDNVTPSNSVNVCSPNKKRVSPPHAIVQELGSSSSAGLKTCRKFILKSVPSFRQSIDSKDENLEPKQSHRLSATPGGLGT